jgi:Rieske Fe-S protein
VDCAACHRSQAAEVETSVHRGVVRCQECHGGQDFYEVESREAERLRQSLDAASATKPSTGSPRPTTPATAPAPGGRAAFDHGSGFRGKPSRAAVPELCGTCHADVERMNPYGLLTDQLSSYWTSGHGRRLKREGDDRVAVCTDCHGTHDVLRHDSPRSRTYFRNVAETCGRCHADPNLMGPYHRSAEVVDQYRRSVHGRSVLERGDSGSPTCATCHGSHAAAPPGYLEVSHVCGRCHKQIEEYFLTSVHGRIPVMARCIGCHARGAGGTTHQIESASPPMEDILLACEEALAAPVASEEELRARFTGKLDARAGPLRLDQVCVTCHSPMLRRDPHAAFFEATDQSSRELGRELAALLRDAQLEFARTELDVRRLARGVLLVKDQALRLEDARTELMALTAFIHTLDPAGIRARRDGIHKICNEVGEELNRMTRGVARWKIAALPVWAFIVIFVMLMYRKYLELRRAFVRAEPAPAGSPAGPPPLSPGRRILLNTALKLLGSLSALALLFPAVAYILPVRKRGAAAERVAAGKTEGWAPWEARKVSVAGKPVVVIRTDAEFRAFSAVCTHLGCIVRWNAEGKEFDCPCHAARFDAQGRVLAGPPPSPLPPYGASVVQGEVIIAPAPAG